MNPRIMLRNHMKPTADSDELCETLRKALSACGIGISYLSKETRDFTLYLATPEAAYSA